jgi:hypothetical protein
MGAFRGPVTLLGTALPYVGGYDTWVAHVAADATVQFVRGIGSTGDESSFESASWIAALPNGACALGIIAPGDVTFDGTTMPASQGPGLMVVLASDGSLARWYRFPSAPAVVVVGDQVHVAFAVNATTTVGGQVYTPDGSDVLIIALGAGVPDRIVGVVRGAGDQTILDLFEVAPDALGIAVRTNGTLEFGATTFDTGATTVRAVGVLGL